MIVLEKEAVVWMAQEYVGLVMLVNKLEHALAWCGGASDFQEGGFAEEGWRGVALPALEAARKFHKEKVVPREMLDEKQGGTK